MLSRVPIPPRRKACRSQCGRRVVNSPKLAEFEGKFKIFDDAIMKFCDVAFVVLLDPYFVGQIRRFRRFCETFVRYAGIAGNSHLPPVRERSGLAGSAISIAAKGMSDEWNDLKRMLVKLEGYGVRPYFKLIGKTLNDFLGLVLHAYGFAIMRPPLKCRRERQQIEGRAAGIIDFCVEIYAGFVETCDVIELTDEIEDIALVLEESALEALPPSSAQNTDIMRTRLALKSTSTDLFKLLDAVRKYRSHLSELRGEMATMEDAMDTVFHEFGVKVTVTRPETAQQVDDVQILTSYQPGNLEELKERIYKAEKLE